jgi:type I restriction enzyme S subunit
VSRKAIRLADVTEVITKGTTPTTLGYDFAETGVPFLRVQNIDGGSVNYERDTLFIDERTHGALKRSQIKPGDILVSIAGTIGRAGLVPDHAPPLNCNQAVAIVRPTEQIFKPFLRLWLESSDAQKQMRGATVTGTISNLSLTQVGDLEIPLPPLAEQRRIAEVLDRAEDLRAKRRAALAQLDSLTQSLFLDLFGDPATNPKGLSVEPLGEHLLFVTSGGRGWAKFYASTGTRFIRSLDVQMNRIRSDDIAFVTAPDNAEARRTRVKTGDVLLTITGSRIGRVGPVPEELEGSYISQHVAILRVDSKRIEPDYLSFFLSLNAGGQRQIAKFQYGQTKPGLNFEQIRRFQVLVPPIELQREFARQVTAVMRLETAHRASLAELDALFATLQYRGFRGEL